MSIQSFCSKALAETSVRLNLDVSFLSCIRKLTYFALLLQMDCRKKGRKEKVPLHFLYFGCKIFILFLNCVKLFPFSYSRQLGHIHRACQQTFALLPEHLFK